MNFQKNGEPISAQKSYGLFMSILWSPRGSGGFRYLFQGILGVSKVFALRECLVLGYINISEGFYPDTCRCSDIVPL